MLGDHGAALGAGGTRAGDEGSSRHCTLRLSTLRIGTQAHLTLPPSSLSHSLTSSVTPGTGAVNVFSLTMVCVCGGGERVCGAVRKERRGARVVVGEAGAEGARFHGRPGARLVVEGVQCLCSTTRRCRPKPAGWTRAWGERGAGGGKAWSCLCPRAFLFYTLSHPHKQHAGRSRGGQRHRGSVVCTNCATKEGGAQTTIETNKGGQQPRKRWVEARGVARARRQ